MHKRTRRRKSNGTLLLFLLAILAIFWIVHQITEHFVIFAYVAYGAGGIAVLVLVWRLTGTTQADRPPPPDVEIVPSPVHVQEIAEQRPAPPANLHLIYVDGDGHQSERDVTVRQVTLGRQGMLVAPAMLQTWCHAAGAERSFLPERVVATSRPGQPAVLGAPLAALDALLRTEPGLLKRGRATPSYNAERTREQPLTTSFGVIYRLSGERADQTMDVRSLVVADGIVVGLRGRRHATKRIASIKLTHLSRLASAETGEVIDPWTAQAWLLSHAGNTGRDHAAS